MDQQRLLPAVDLNLVLLLIVIDEPDLSAVLQSKAICGTLSEVNPVHPVNLPVVLSHHGVANELIVDHLLIVSLVPFLDLLKPFQDISVGNDLVHQINIQN
jgi:hypothetical protein